ncbi:uncharacterized protein TRIADDRAFT_25986, partial [Trichoplax adhaerens]
AVQILNVENQNNLQLNEAALESVLMREDFRDKKVVVVSINGKYRQGKSFLLNFFRFYLEKQIANHQRSNNRSIDWLDHDHIDHIRGFKWKRSSKRVTTGMYMWHRPFLVQLPDGEEVAVVLIDTQGLFDNTTSPLVNSVIFVLSTIISSQQIINVQKNISQVEFEQLKFVTQYAKYVTENRNAVPFQNLTFLVRDWINYDEYEFGVYGGNKYLQDLLTEVQQKAIKSIFC